MKASNEEADSRAERHGLRAQSGDARVLVDVQRAPSRIVPDDRCRHNRPRLRGLRGLRGRLRLRLRLRESVHCWCHGTARIRLRVARLAC